MENSINSVYNLREKFIILFIIIFSFFLYILGWKIQYCPIVCQNRLWSWSSWNCKLLFFSLLYLKFERHLKRRQIILRLSHTHATGNPG